MNPLLFPEKLDLYSEIDPKELILQLFTIFRADFIDTKPYFKSKPVVFDNSYKESEYPEGFWHIITRGKDDRRMDFKRAKRLPWLKCLIQQWNHPDLRCWSEMEYDESAGHAISKYFIWYVEGSYLAVLKEKPGRYFLVTAFHVTGQRNNKKYEDKYNKGNTDFKK